MYVIDVAGGEKIPRKGGPAQTYSDLLLINKIDLADLVGARVDVMLREAQALRGERPVFLAALRNQVGVDDVIHWVEHRVADGPRPSLPAPAHVHAH
jgi:urease accessory protein